MQTQYEVKPTLCSENICPYQRVCYYSHMLCSFSKKKKKEVAFIMASNISVQKTQAEAKYAACKDQKKAFEVTTV